MTCLELDDHAILKVAEPMMDDTIAGLAQRDYVLHAKHFSVALKSVIEPQGFIEACDERRAAWGNPEGRTLVAIFRKHRSFTLVWDQSFDRSEGQVMAVLTIAVKGGRHFVDHFLLH